MLLGLSLGSRPLQCHGESSDHGQSCFMLHGFAGTNHSGIQMPAFVHKHLGQQNCAESIGEGQTGGGC